MNNVKTKLEENGFYLPATITELKFYDDSNPLRVISTLDETKKQQ